MWSTMTSTAWARRPSAPSRTPPAWTAPASSGSSFRKGAGTMATMTTTTTRATATTTIMTTTMTMTVTTRATTTMTMTMTMATMATTTTRATTTMTTTTMTTTTTTTMARTKTRTRRPGRSAGGVEAEAHLNVFRRRRLSQRRASEARRGVREALDAPDAAGARRRTVFGGSVASGPAVLHGKEFLLRHGVLPT